MIVALLLVASVHAATVTDSWLSTPNGAATTQVLSGDRIAVEIAVTPGSRGTVQVVWYHRGTPVKTSRISVTRPRHVSDAPVKRVFRPRRTGEWTVLIDDASGTIRSHQFVVR